MHTKHEVQYMNAMIRQSSAIERIADALEGRSIEKILPRISSLLQDYDVKTLNEEWLEEAMNFEQKCLLEIGRLLNLI